MKDLENIVPGTQFQFDLNDLALVGRGAKRSSNGDVSYGIALHYKQGLVVPIEFSDPLERDTQYKIICKLHRIGKYNDDIMKEVKETIN